jgi:putative sterol carrier protein
MSILYFTTVPVQHHGGSHPRHPSPSERQQAAGLRVSYELRFRGGPRYRLAIKDGTAEVTEAGEKVDCWISADPVAFLLVGYGRIGQWGPILRGRMMAGGRKPWLGFKFGGLLTSP